MTFVAINYITCQPDFAERFEYLFSTRAGEIDKMEGFKYMEVLRPASEGKPYLIVSHWEAEEHFKAWTKSEAFLKGHRRGFEDIQKAKEEGRTPPMTSDFQTYTVIAT